MKYNDLIHSLQILTKSTITQTELGEVLNYSAQTINKRAKRNSRFVPAEIEIIENHYKIKLSEPSQNESADSFDLNKTLEAMCEKIIDRKLNEAVISQIADEVLKYLRAK